MLQEDGFEALSKGRIFLLYSEKSEDITVLSDHEVFLNRIVVVFAIVFELQFGLGVGRIAESQQKQEGKEDLWIHFNNIMVRELLSVRKVYDKKEEG